MISRKERDSSILGLSRGRRRKFPFWDTRTLPPVNHFDLLPQHGA